MPNGKSSWAKSKAPTLSKADTTRKRLGVVNPYSPKFMPLQRSAGAAWPERKRT